MGKNKFLKDIELPHNLIKCVIAGLTCTNCSLKSIDKNVNGDLFKETKHCRYLDLKTDDKIYKYFEICTQFLMF
jgi:hypothetical protein